MASTGEQARPRPRILVVGPGAIGTLLAVRLKCRQRSVTMAVRDAQQQRSLPRVLTAEGLDDRPLTAEVPVVTDPATAGTFDVLLLATKCQDARPALETWLPTLAADAAVVAMQNGLMGDALAPLAGDRLVECTVAFPASLRAPGRSEQTGPGGLIIGPWPDARMEPATPLHVAEVLREAAPTRIHRNMRGVKWTKLLINSAITGLGAMTGRALGDLLQDRRARTAFLHIVAEGHAAGAAAGVRFERVAGFHPRMALVRGGSRLAIARGHAVLQVVGRKHGRQESSSLQSLRRGRPTEVPFLNGRIVEEAQRHGLQAPVNAAVADIVHAIEQGETEPAPAHLDRLPFRFQ